jgi:hypothetical protein
MAQDKEPLIEALEAAAVELDEATHEEHPAFGAGLGLPGWLTSILVQIAATYGPRIVQAIADWATDYLAKLQPSRGA